MDCYGDAPLENVGYAVIDLDGDGIEELVIGTTERFTDEFYGKLILALYTRDGEDTKHTVFQSIARDRYYYAGENKFANLGSSGADDSVDITVQYAGGTLTDIGIVTDPADYVQMELTPMSKEIPLAADQAETIHNLNPSFPVVCSPSHWLGPRMSLPSIATTPFTS